MARKIRDRLGEESGFTLIELLAVIVIIGILAAIALPNFLGQRDKAADASAKSNARNLASHVEACFAVEQNFTHCDSDAELPNTGVDYGTTAGKAAVTDSDPTSYTITAYSSGNGGGAHEFMWTRASVGAAAERSCTPTGEGGCSAEGTW